METRADHAPSDEPSAPPAAATYPRWCLLEYFGSCDDPDARTVARARTSKGRPISISLVLAAPPAVSGLCLVSPGLPDGVSIFAHAIAAHGDSVLVKVKTRSDPRSDRDDHHDDYFLYCAGEAAASRPPSLSLLPACYLTEQNPFRPKQKRYMHPHGIALLRRGQDEVLVAALNFHVKKRDDVFKAELCLLRSGDREWDRKRLLLIHDECKRHEICCWQTDKVIPVGDRFLLWVDYSRGIIYSDPWQETPKLRYVSLPVEPDPWQSQNRWESTKRSVCATDGGRAVRFVEIFPRCCCGCPGATACVTSCYTFGIATWALRMDDMTKWDKVGVVNCDELWSLPGYHGIVPWIKPEYPTVSLDDPDVLCFVVDKKKYHMSDVDDDHGTQLIEFDTRRMELRSIYHCDHRFSFGPNFIASPLSQYFDASSYSHTPARRKDTVVEAPTKPSKLTIPRAVASPEEMLATLREIPDLARDDMLKAYVVLTWDECQLKSKSLLAFPIHMRKDYCLMIGNLSCFDEYGGVGNLVC